MTLLQARALLLLAVFLAAGTSLPSADALLHHTGAEPRPVHAHLEPAGGCPEHGGHCMLGRTAPGSNATLNQPAEIRHQPSGRSPSEPAAALDAPPASSVTLPPQRAPPALR